ncbi:MAG: elongator complex protein 3 [Desulfatibacillaceae bacterium]
MTGQKHLVVPVFLPQAGCPHQCVFCNQHALCAAPAVPDLRAIRDQVDRWLERPTSRRGPVQISFYGGNFLGLDRDLCLALLGLAAEYAAAGKVDSLRFSTRPDTVDEERLSWLAGHPVRTVELGVQSMDDRVLRRSGRGHLAADSVRAANLLKAAGYEVGLQLMPGLPGDTRETSVETARRTVLLAPDFTRIYPALVLAGSPMASMWKRGDYRPLDLSDAVETCRLMVEVLDSAHIPVVRMGLHADDRLLAAGTVLAGPLHPAFGHLVMSAVMRERAIRELEASGIAGGVAEIRVCPKDSSRIRGHENGNLVLLRERFGLEELRIVEDDSLEQGDVRAGRPAL